MSKVDLKIVFLGQHDVGKTCLVERYLNDRFRDDVAATVGAAFGAKKVTVGDRVLTLGIWDTAGTERYESMSRIYYRSARAACVCFDLTKPETWSKVKFWVNELLANEKDCALYIIGTKCDLILDGIEQRKVNPDTVEEYARSVQAKVFETSAKTGFNVEALFQTISEDFVHVNRESGGSGSTDNPIPGHHSTTSDSSSSCNC